MWSSLFAIFDGIRLYIELSIHSDYFFHFFQNQEIISPELSCSFRTDSNIFDFPCEITWVSLVRRLPDVDCRALRLIITLRDFILKNIVSVHPNCGSIVIYYNTMPIPIVDMYFAFFWIPIVPVPHNTETLSWITIWNDIEWLRLAWRPDSYQTIVGI